MSLTQSCCRGHRPIDRIPASTRDDIARWTENVLDYDILVDDARADVERALDELRVRVEDRDRAVRHLADLIHRHAAMLE